MFASAKNNLSIKTPVFEGPLELLLDLVERRKLLINDISLAEVTDEYMRQVSLMQEQSLPHTTQFVQMAATLLLIKSKSLLPVLTLTEEEEEGIDDLEARLRLYQIYRDAGKDIQEKFGTSILHERQFSPDREPLFVTDRFTSLEALEGVIAELLSHLPFKEVKPKVKVKPTITLEEMIGRLQSRIESQLRCSLRELINGSREKTHLIVGFLAVLESVKQGGVLVRQSGHFADIEIESERPKLPHYH